MLKKRKNEFGILTRLMRDERGSTSAIGLILVTTVIAIGATVGLVSIRNHIVQEFGDAAVGLDRLDQSFSYRIRLDSNADGTFDFDQQASFADASTLVDLAGDEPACLNMSIAPTGE